MLAVDNFYEKKTRLPFKKSLLNSVKYMVKTITNTSDIHTNNLRK